MTEYLNDILILLTTMVVFFGYVVYHLFKLTNRIYYLEQTIERLKHHGNYRDAVVRHRFSMANAGGVHAKRDNESIFDPIRR